MSILLCVFYLIESLSPRERGLKHEGKYNLEVIAGSLSPRERGLKQSHWHSFRNPECVALPARAWIETRSGLRQFPAVQVALPARAWIETGAPPL